MHSQKEEPLVTELDYIKKKVVCMEEELDELREESFKLHKDIDNLNAQIEKLIVKYRDEENKAEFLSLSLATENQKSTDLEVYCTYYLTDIEGSLLILESNIDNELLKVINHIETEVIKLKSSQHDSDDNEVFHDPSTSFLDHLRDFRCRLSTIKEYSQDKRADKVHKFISICNDIRTFCTTPFTNSLV